MKFGLFGGTFNPVHYGHLRSAEDVREGMALDRIIFIPSASPPHKDPSRILPSGHRLRMTKIAIRDNPAFECSDVECRRSGRSYSIETIQFFQERSGLDGAFFFIMGIDAFLDIQTWRDYREIFSLCNFVITTRPGYIRRPIDEILPIEVVRDFCYDKNKDRYLHSGGYSLTFQEITFNDLSATKIRERVRAGESINQMTPRGVIRYIEKNRLFRE